MTRVGASVARLGRFMARLGGKRKILVAVGADVGPTISSHFLKRATIEKLAFEIKNGYKYSTVHILNMYVYKFECIILIQIR